MAPSTPLQHACATHLQRDAVRGRALLPDAAAGAAAAGAAAAAAAVAAAAADARARLAIEANGLYHTVRIRRIAALRAPP